ncbi:cycloartenol synthase-like [Magnolia sinica]|uniref:cycloartenol synthase-like n=1 Tax=Magnolia sinica TaxID=86752 RepID=UPI002658EBDD|nr:cycloartenol synthase-like [Magnolia sinica]
MLYCWVEDPNSEAFKLHLPRIFDYLWLAEDGMKMQGYNGSQLLDTAFTVQAIISTSLLEEFGPTLKKAHEYIKNSQVLEDCPGDLSFWYCHISKGAWPLSTRDHGWPISDCTAEGLKASLLLSQIPSKTVGEPIDANRLYDAVNVILSLQEFGCQEDMMFCGVFDGHGPWGHYSKKGQRIAAIISALQLAGDSCYELNYIRIPFGI